MQRKLNENSELELRKIAARVRFETVRLIINAQAGHTGGDLSCIEILVFLYKHMNIYPKDPKNIKRDYFIMSKGHAAEAYYQILAEFGYFDKHELRSLGELGSKFAGHPTQNIPGVEANTGSLGHGLNIGTGIALGLKRDKKNNKVFVLSGDGELAEGSNWEAAMTAANFQLNNLTWIIDRNDLQISGNTEEVMKLEPLKAKLESFGFIVYEIDGHSFSDLNEVFIIRNEDKPKAIIAKTIKSKGITKAENKKEWHHKVPGKDELNQLKVDMKNVLKESIYD